MAGWIKIHRSIQKWEWWDDPKTLKVFLTILLNANHEPGRWQGHDVGKGQWITGRKKLAKLTGISEQSIRTILVRLERTGEIELKSTKQYTLISVVKWDSYQVDEKDANQQLTNDQPTTNQQLTTNKNVKNEKNKKEKPSWLDLETWQDFKTMRVKKKKPMTERAETMLINKLEGFNQRGIDPNKALEQSILHCWDTVYEPKADKQDEPQSLYKKLG